MSQCFAWETGIYNLALQKIRNREITDKMGKTLSLLRAILALAFGLAFSVTAVDDIPGGNGSWNIFHHGVGDSQTSAFSLPRACSNVVLTLEAARMGDFARFCSYFGYDTNQPPEELKQRYGEWSNRSRRYVFLIVQEALLTNPQSSDSALSAAVSIAPAVLRESEEITADSSELKAEVIFAEQRGEVWRLLPGIVDREIERVLRDRASRFLYRPKEFSREAILQRERKFNEYVLDQMHKRGASVIEIVSKKESFQRSEAGVQMRNWADWTNYYRAVLLDPPVVFNRRDPFPMDFSDPVSAFRSHHRARFVGDGGTLLKYSDASGADDLRQQGISDEPAREAKGHIAPKTLNKVTVLLTATAFVDGKEYVQILWRAQNEHAPTNGPIALQRTFFVRTKREEDDKPLYFFTQDLRDSMFAAVLALARANGAGHLRYADFYRIMSQSEFPKHFYAVE